MNKLLGNLTTLLFAPIPAAGVDVGSNGNGANVASVPGKPTGAAPAADNFYSSGPVDDGKVTGGKEAIEDFTDKAAGGEEQVEQVDKGEDFVSLKDGPVDDPEEVAVDPVVKVETPAAQPLLKLDPETIAALRGTPVGGAKKDESPRLSVAQLKEMLNPVEVTPEVLQSMGFSEATPEQVAGFQNFANATVKNAVSITRQLIAQARKEVEAAIGPLTQHHQDQQIDQTRSEFYTANKDLAKYEKIVKLATQELSSDPANSNKSKAELFKLVADRTRATLKEYGVNLSTPANPGAGGGGQVPKPNKSAPSGRSGGDTNGQRGRPNDADADIYKR